MKEKKFVSIEGPDSAGKTTIANKLDKLEGTVSYKTPPDGFNEKEFFDKEASVESRYLYYLAGLVESSREIEELVEEKNVVADRYDLSTLFYHQAMIEEPEYQSLVEGPEELEEILGNFDIMYPDKTYILIAEEDELRKRIDKRHDSLDSGSLTDKNIEENDGFRSSIIEKYESFRGSEDREVMQIDTTYIDVDEVVEKIRYDMGI